MCLLFIPWLLGDASKIDLSTMEQHVTTYCEEAPHNAKEFDTGRKTVNEHLITLVHQAYHK
jgi:hypothetical protein